MSTQSIADFLVYDFFGGTSRKFASNEITFNVTNLDATNKQLAREALEDWTEVAPLKFTEVEDAARITFYQNGPVSATYFNILEETGEIWSADIRLSHWLTLSDADYKYQTILHEIGHALGLGHPGFYNGWADESLRLFELDQTDYTVMSYFRGEFNVVGPQEADILAIQELYGVPEEVNYGDTAYNLEEDLHYHLYDTSGVDTVYFEGKHIDLRPGSSTDWVSVQEDTMIENIFYTETDVHIVGNSADNIITWVG